MGLLDGHPGVARSLVLVAAIAASAFILLYRPRRPPEADIMHEPKTKNGHDQADPFHGRAVLREVSIDVPTRYADEIAEACRVAGWRVRDSGLTVSTDDDEHALTTLLVDIPLGPRSTNGQTNAAAIAAAPVDARIPYLFHAIYSNRDLFLGDDVQIDNHVSAEGKVVVGAGARIKGRIRAGGDVVVKDGAVVGHVVSEGAVRLEGGARVTDAVEARGGLVRDPSVVQGARALRAPEPDLP